MKPIFVDTSALYALFDQGDRFHQAAANVFSRFSPDSMLLVSSSYVVLETLNLLQTRIGMSAVRKWKTEFQPILEIIWVDRQLHEQALIALIAANRPGISLTDWTSFGIMRERDIEDAFSFDRHFSQQGFNIHLA
jgi:predicted nucleic acid-binding protein